MMHATRIVAVDPIPMHGLTLAELQWRHHFTLTSALPD